ncbi:alpha/beta fold hydrolase [Actinoplanes sp. NBRC 101535]|uniref:alpha/beta hydrolase n=1 Tax=Actinoplanes sp. NBRC 101535 TaxID=3032196 RepID=UPI002552F08D|nr:alpha/beta fold hydrolase [Actinoplanes sp. NBRC 101535]
MRMVLLRGVPAVIVVVLLLIALAWVFQRRVIYFPDRLTPPLPSSARAVVLHTVDGLDLAAWSVPPPPDVTDRRIAVLVAHGNGGSRSGRMLLATALAGRGLTVLLLDYRGYGGNPGSPTEQGLAHDADAARSYLIGEAGFAADHLIYFGESLGTAVATGLAVRHPPAGLLLRSPFTDLAAAGSVHYPFLPVRALLRDRFPVAERVTQVKAPTIVVYGSADTIVPPSQSQAVADAAANLTQAIVVPDAGHNDRTFLDGPELLTAVETLAIAIG